VTTQFGFARNSRLHLNRDFEEVFKAGGRIVKDGFVLWYKLIPGENTRIGIAVSRKFGSAVERNRAKRLIREVFRLNRDKLKDGAQLIISLRGGMALNTLGAVETLFCDVCGKAGLIKNPGGV
jgi:ribonuclease P protein component